jgi:HEAT repeat protein
MQIRLAILGCLTMAIAASNWRLGEAADDLDARIDDSLADMTTGGSTYDPKHLHELGLPGLEGLLDRLYPETAAKPVEPPAARVEEVRILVKQLADDEFRSREQATERLIAIGKPHRDLLTTAADDDDAEVRLRARRILAAWEPKPGGLADQSLGGFWKYAEGIRDRERLEALARRSVRVLEAGWPEGSKVHLTRLCLAGVAKGGAEQPCELLRPLLDHKDPRVAKLAVETVGSYRQPDFFPQLLVDAIQVENDEVAEVAVRWCQRCGGLSRSEAIRDALRQVFTGRNDSLRFQSSLPLSQEFDDPRAWLYLIEQTQSKEPLRAASAQSRLAGLSPSGKLASDELLAALRPLLGSDKLPMRWGAVKVIGTHAGENVVLVLLPLIADKEQSIADEASRGIMKQKDAVLARQLLASAVRDHSSEAVRAKAAILLAQIDKRTMETK